MPHFDRAVVGSGLAGAALAWQWRLRGRTVLLIDRGDAVTPSRVAAGLITPITGKRLAIDPNFDSLLAAAEQLYTHVERIIGTKLLHRDGAVRILKDDAEAARYTQRRERMLRGRTEPATLDTQVFHAPFGAFAMTQALRLDVYGFLDATRRAFEKDGAFRQAAYPACDPGIRPLVIATGIAAARDGTLPAQRFEPARGDILTVHIPGLHESRVVHRGIWLVQVGPQLYRVGATYDWATLSDTPSAAGRAELESRLRECLKLPFDVLQHDAAVRPISRSRQPIAEPIAPGIWAFNGLGSRGTLLAPWHAARLIEQIETGDQPRPNAAAPPRVTARVHELLAAALQSGDAAIDATAGNGHDTLHLARLVGPHGQVFAFDIQPRALELTAARLHAAGIANAQLIQANHAEMAAHIPPALHGKFAAAVFNLGFLPGGDKAITTTPADTARALEAARQLLRPGGLLIAVAYIGHPGGDLENQTVQSTLGIEPEPACKPSAPRLYVLRK